MHRLSIAGLSVDGRDVLLSGPAQSDLLSPNIRQAIEQVDGVRAVRTRVLAGDPAQTQTSQLSPEDVQRKLDRVLENQGISFKTDTTTLTPDSELVLDKLAAELAQAPGLLCEIRGYENQTGAARQNWILALQRALAAEDYLENKGIASWRLSTRAFHAGEPAPGARPGRALEFVLHTQKEEPGIRE